jgi:hypothetical protein
VTCNWPKKIAHTREHRFLSPLPPEKYVPVWALSFVGTL